MIAQTQYDNSLTENLKHVHHITRTKQNQIIVQMQQILAYDFAHKDRDGQALRMQQLDS